MIIGNETVFTGFDNNGQPTHGPDPRIAEVIATLRTDLTRTQSALEEAKAQREKDITTMREMATAYNIARAEVDKWKQRADDIKHATEQTVEGLRTDLTRTQSALEEARRPWQVELAFPENADPFNRADCRILDTGHADRILIVECPEVAKLAARNQATGGQG